MLYSDLPAKIKVWFLYEEEPIAFSINDRTKSNGKFDEAKLSSAYELFKKDVNRFIGQMLIAGHLLTYSHEDNFFEQRFWLKKIQKLVKPSRIGHDKFFECLNLMEQYSQCQVKLTPRMMIDPIVSETESEESDPELAPMSDGVVEHFFLMKHWLKGPNDG